jgi:hypothetical protein
LGTRLAVIEGHPAIRLTPEQHGRAIERAGAATLREAMETFRNEAAAIGHERRQLGQIIGAAVIKKRSDVGSCGSRPLRGGSYLAALAMETIRLSCLNR